MDDLVFIKKCGRDKLGNTGIPARENIKGREFRQDEVEIVTFSAAGVHEQRGPTLNKKTCEIDYKKTKDEVVQEHAAEAADGRPYFVGTVADIPEAARTYRDALAYNEADNTLFLDVEVAKEIHMEVLKGEARKSLNALRDPLLGDTSGAQAELLHKLNNIDLSSCKTFDEVIKVTL